MTSNARGVITTVYVISEPMTLPLCMRSITIGGGVGVCGVDTTVVTLTREICEGENFEGQGTKIRGVEWVDG